MIEAKKSPMFQWGFHQYNRRLIKYSFHRFYVGGASQIPNGSAVFVANHSSWWDALIVFHLSQTFISQPLYAMMHEPGLKKYRFFQKLGAFSINRENPKDIRRTFTYCRELLQRDKAVWIFPQGDEFHLEKRPLDFKPGVLQMVKPPLEVPIVPVSFYYSFLHHRKPEVFVRFGRAITYEELKGATVREKSVAFEQICTNELDLLREKVMREDFSSFSQIL